MMNSAEFNAILNSATPAQQLSLESAHWRYMTLIGHVRGLVDPEIASGDREAFPRYSAGAGHSLAFSEADCCRFMIAVTGISAKLCAAWADPDFYSLQGETYNSSLADPVL
ncbi:hypothetical protein LCG56_27385 (plasmid) [Pseudomonas cannabina pv. alisalensis]|uniref:Uncharacterized protein n=1 Tax=Pseudomonas syringae pv. maculicola str. ES4326 TaxID=629265 RepID=A0A8T8CAA6_PSEYM|nr:MULTISPECIES: hypothetical protein [Pseudomonas syringae group]QHF00510.1 hypothetical protein PMA4326_028765 [Pseudomonas syringae pv. maculicola str. ES4326]UBZ00489.1 hypothetical protein LCG56_27385 [Pseudomonas cannabina pv. alisalensis]